MLKLTQKLFIFSLLFSILLAPFRTTTAADFKREVIYQIITDRFFDGNTSNNNPAQSAGLYDSIKTNWRMYWGGDLAGIQQKMSYLAGMGVTTIWISPPVDNLNTNIPDANGSGWDDRYQVQYYTLFDLADINQEHATMDSYLKAAAQQFQQHGVDGFRIDAVKHLNWGWQYSLANSIYTFGDSFLFGEWYQGNTSDPLYHDSYKFANKSGISLLDFPLNTAIRSVFGSNTNFSDIDSVIATEGNNFTWKEDLVTFIDNHDMARFLSINNNNNRLHEAMAFTLTSRGIPCIYYGTEQYLHNDTGGGTDPYNRPMMSSFSTTTTAYQLVNKLSTLRHNNTALAYGSMGQRWINNDVYIYERKFFV